MEYQLGIFQVQHAWLLKAFTGYVYGRIFDLYDIYGCILTLYGLYGIYRSVYFNGIMTGLPCKKFMPEVFCYDHLLFELI